ncbi:MAG TPA: hypothetical protein VME66_03835, partial [Candidatus Acidoferrales bacterium]|nr:hypothetical protein [Candidatus Acidoferrales bacterium]
MLAFFLVPTVASATATAPNTVITNTATASYTDANGLALSTTSNTVSTTVQNAPTMTLSSPSGQNVAVDDVVLSNTFTATNTGNASGNFTLPSAATISGTGGGTVVGYV